MFKIMVFSSFLAVGLTTTLSVVAAPSSQVDVNSLSNEQVINQSHCGAVPEKNCPKFLANKFKSQKRIRNCRKTYHSNCQRWVNCLNGYLNDNNAKIRDWSSFCKV